MRRIGRSLAILIVAGGAIWVARTRRRASATDRTWTDLTKVDLREFVTHRLDPLVIRLGLAGGHGDPPVGSTVDLIRRA
jgi:hypothetical protein